MREHAGSVCGLDVSETMVDLAMRRAKQFGVDKLHCSVDMPDGKFDWINSFIVFQHIPPDEGLPILEELLSRAADKCVLSIHFTFWREDHLILPKPKLNGLFRWIHKTVLPERTHSVEELVSMYDYDFGSVYGTFERHGFTKVLLEHVNHGGHHGAWMFSRKA